MHVLVLFDVPARDHRKAVQRRLGRFGFVSLFANAYERSATGNAELKRVERALVKLLRGQVYHLRIYAWGAHTRLVERWGRGARRT